MKNILLHTVTRVAIAMIAGLLIALLLPTNPRSTFLYLVKIKGHFDSLLNQKKTYAYLGKTPTFFMKQISKGIYAKEDKELGTIYIKISKDIQWEEKIINVNGQKILLKVSK
jgi:hypothetical protein